MSLDASGLKELTRKKVCGGYIATFEHQSTSVKGKMTFGVFFPQEAKDRAVPALMYLSGLTCSPMNCIEKGNAFAPAAKAGIMLVFPDTSPRECKIDGDRDSWDFGVAAGFYLDATTPKFQTNYNMGTYVTKELPALLQSAFAGQYNGRISVTGHSMGGHGALVSFLRNPGVFQSASAFAPICNPCECPWGVKAFSGYLGDDKTAWPAYDATRLVAEYKGPKVKILIDQGTEDGFYKKKQLLPEAFEAACKKAGYPAEVRMQQGYDHSYYFVSTFMADHISFAAQFLNSESA